MARSKIDIVQIGWTEIASGSLAGPASFIGLDVNGDPVLIAASDYVAAGGGSGISHDGSTADGVLTYKDSDEATVESNLTFDGSTLTVAGDIHVGQYIRHNDDSNTHINFTDDKIGLKAGNKAMITMEEKGTAPHDVTINDGSNNIDFVVKGNGSNAGNPGMFFDASTNRVGINGVGTPSWELDVAGDIGLAEHIYHKGDDDTFIRFDNDTIILKAGGWSMFKALQSSGSILVNNGGHDLDFVVKAAGSGSLIYTDAGDSIVCISTDSSAGSVGTDANFYVSGTIGAKAAGDRGVSVFAGDMVISGTLNVESQLTASNGLQISNVPTGSLAGPASFLGLDTNSRVIQIAASDYVSAGGTDTYTLTERGHAYMGYPHRKYLHYPGGFSSTYESSREWAKYSSGWGDSQDTSIATTVEDAFAYWATFVVPADCTVDSAVAWYKANQTQNTYIGIYSADMSSADDSASNVTFQEMKRGTSSGNTSGRAHKVTLTSLSNNSLSAGDIIAVALDGNQTGNTSWSAQTLYFHIAIKISPS